MYSQFNIASNNIFIFITLIFHVHIRNSANVKLFFYCICLTSYGALNNFFNFLVRVIEHRGTFFELLWLPDFEFNPTFINKNIAFPILLVCQARFWFANLIYISTLSYFLYFNLLHCHILSENFLKVSNKSKVFK